MRNNQEKMGQQYYAQLSYIRELYANEDELLKKIRNKCLLDNRPITINPEEGKILQFLIKSNNVKTIIEVGMLYGYSTIWLARALEYDGKIYTIEKDEKSINIANEFFNKLDNKSKNKIEILSGDANKKLEELIEKNIQC